MYGASFPVRLTEVAVFRRVENYYYPAHHIIFTPESEPKRLLRIYTCLRFQILALQILWKKKSQFSVLQNLFNNVHLWSTPAR